MTARALRATILGCGSSGGVPRIGGADGTGDWGACDPANPKNRRRRCALLIEQDGPEGTTRVLIDAGADLREQLLGAGVSDLDAVIFTHDHADHIHGIDDLRPIVLRRRRRLDCWADACTADILSHRFGYVFIQPEGSAYPPILNLQVHDERVTVEGAGGIVTAEAHIVEHGANVVARGFRIGDLAYTPDVSLLREDTPSKLAGLDTWIVDALRYTPHPTHAHVDRTLEWIAEIRPRRAILTNLHIDLDYDELSARLPEGVEVAHDGMLVAFSGPDSASHSGAFT